MHQFRIHQSRPSRCLSVVACVAAVLVASACGSSGSTPNDGGGTTSPVASKTFGGTLSDGSAVSLTFAAATAFAPLPRTALVAQARSGAAMTGSVSGTITPPGGAPIAITGSYDPATGDFTISGGAYTLSGTYSNGALQGTCTKNGVEIAFVAVDATSASVAHYCGTYAGDKYGVLTFVVSAGKAYAFVNGAVLAGTATGGAVNVTGAVASNTSVTVTGTVTSADASGSWTATDGNTGTWSVSTAECSNAASIGGLCDKAVTAGAAMFSKLQPCLGSSTPPNGGLPSGTECMSEMAQCTSADAAVLSTLLDCLNALPALTACSTTEMTSFENAANACSADAVPQLSAACLAATNIQ